MNQEQRSSRPAPGSDSFEADNLSEASMARPAGQNMLKQVLHGFIRRWYWIALGLCLGLVWGDYQLGKIPKLYSATATLLIKEQTASVMGRDQVDEISLRSQEALNTVVARIRRGSLLERVASRQDVRDLPGIVPPPVDWRPKWLLRRLGKASAATAGQTAAPPVANGGTLAGWLGVSVRHGTRLLDISITHPVPEVAKALADAVAYEYLAEIATTSTKGRSKVIDLLEYESKEARASLRDASSTLSIYSRALEVHKLLAAKETETVALQRRYLPKHPRMIEAGAELKQLQESFICEFEIAREATSDRSYWEGTELPEPQTDPAKYLRSARQQLLAHIGVLQSEISSSTSVFNGMLTRIQETSVNQESEESSAEVSELASVPGSPSSPDPTKVRSSGVMGGIFGGLLLAFLFLRLDNKYQTVSQIANATGVPILGAVPEIKLHHLAVAEKSYRKRHPDEVVDMRAAWEKRVVFRNGSASTSYAEMYRALRASVSRLGDESMRKITLFSSALPGEGKTLTSANFAAGAAGQGRKTLLIDLDLRKPAIHRMFGLAREHEHGGITECLANLATYEEVICHESGHEHLDLILGGKHAPNPGELLNTDRLRELLAQACRDYEVVVLDTAPFLAVPDTRIIAPLAHNFCLVAKADYVPKGAIRRALEILQDDCIPLSGIIFNGYRERRYLMGDNYSYGYYKPSRYGSTYRYSYDSYGSYGYSGG
jgi:capsular exopolysaccharide synthesis family protein